MSRSQSMKTLVFIENQVQNSPIQRNLALAPIATTTTMKDVCNLTIYKVLQTDTKESIHMSHLIS